MLSPIQEQACRSQKHFQVYYTLALRDCVSTSCLFVFPSNDNSQAPQPIWHGPLSPQTNISQLTLKPNHHLTNHHLTNHFHNNPPSQSSWSQHTNFPQFITTTNSTSQLAFTKDKQLGKECEVRMYKLGVKDGKGFVWATAPPTKALAKPHSGRWPMAA